MTERQRCVLDAFAVLAWLQGEPGAETVEPLLDRASISAANWSEVLQKVAQRGRDAAEVRALLPALGLEIVPLTEQDAALAAEYWRAAPPLSLADRCCLALARRLDVPAVTADSTRPERELANGPQTVLIRSHSQHSAATPPDEPSPA